MRLFIDIYMLYANDNGRFAARNRLNRQGDAAMGGEHGGSRDYGPPYHVHTFYSYVPPETFKQHPEWFSLINGKRTAEQAQLCLTNKELREFVVQRLKAFIKSAREKAAQMGVPAPDVFDISQNDWGGMCQCEPCQAIAKAEGLEAGPLFDFINYIADAIKDEYPDVFIDTLAYMMTQQAPKTIKPRDNVIVRLCDTTSNFTKSVTDPQNRAFREHLLSWAKIAKHLRIWDYAVTYAPYYGLPLPTVHTYPVDYRFYAEHNVEGVFTEQEYPILADMRDFKVWMMMKLLEEPDRDYTSLTWQFTNGFYGAAGKYIREYLSLLETASNAKTSYLSMGASPRQYRYLDLKFIQQAQAIFARAEKAIGSDAVLLRRVRHARLPLDRASVVLFPELMREWMRAGNDPEKMPIDRDAIARRYRETWHAQIDLRLPPNQRAAEKKAADDEVTALTARKTYVPLLEKFRNLPVETAFDYTADTTRNWQNIVKIVPDPEAELPMPWGLYDQLNKRSGGGASIKPEDVPGPGCHWYKMGTFTIGASYYLYFFWSWIIQVDVDDVVGANRPDQKFDVWARIKFEGPGFLHGAAKDKNAICVERVVLVKTGAK